MPTPTHALEPESVRRKSVETPGPQASQSGDRSASSMAEGVREGEGGFRPYTIVVFNTGITAGC